MTYEESDFFSLHKEERHKRKQLQRRDRSYRKITDQKKTVAPSDTTGEKGQITAIESDAIEVTLSCGKKVRGILRGTLKQHPQQSKTLVATGDYVTVLPIDEEQVHIKALLPRHSILKRADLFRGFQYQILAANVDRLVITQALSQPIFRPTLIDRYLIAGYKGGMQPVICLNKADTPQAESLGAQWQHYYTAAGFTCHLVSAYTGCGLDALHSTLKGALCLFSGPSGVGKSSLISKLTGITIATQPLVEKTGKGTHTTVGSRIYPIQGGGRVIDGPGIRHFSPWDCQPEDVIYAYPEIATLATNCQFSSCTHLHEPGCAVQAEVGHALPAARYACYQQLYTQMQQSNRPR